MIRSVGIDIVEVARIAKAANNPRFVQRILTARELKTPMPIARLAGRWAAKEAVAKCLGTHLAWHQVEILYGSNGKPEVLLEEGAIPGFSGSVHVSISHEKAYAAAVAIWETPRTCDGLAME